MIIDPNKHIFLTSYHEVDEIIAPLKDFFGITSFVYQKNFDDGSEIRLSNQPAWMHYFYEHELYKKSFFERPPSEFSKARLVWAGLTIHNPILEKAREFNIDHGITFVEPCVGGCEFFFIGTTVDHPQARAKCLSNLDLIERFLDYFREKAQSLIEQAAKQKIIIPNKFIQAPTWFGVEEVNRDAFLNRLMPIDLTARQLDCVRLLVKGYSMKMIAQELNISPRTVESYVEQIKVKTQTYSKGELVKFLLKMPL